MSKADKPDQITPQVTAQWQKALLQKMLGQSTVHFHAAQDMIVIDSDKLRLLLFEYSVAVRARRQWVAPAGIMFSLLALLFAADLRPVLGLTPDYLRAFFTISALIAFVWLTFAIWNSFQALRKGGVDSLISRLKDNQTNTGDK